MFPLLLAIFSKVRVNVVVVVVVVVVVGVVVHAKAIIY